MNFTKGWHVLYVKSRHEKKVSNELLNTSIDAFLPMIKTQRVWSDRKKTILAPLFPSYVFVNIRTPLEFHKGLAVNGSCAYIRFGNEYATVREQEITRIKLLVGTKKITDINAVDRNLKTGTFKKIMQGPLKGLECEILKTNNTNKIIVRIKSIQQNIIATIPVEYLV